MRSLPTLEGARKANTVAWEVFQATVAAIAASETKTLIGRIETASDPLLLWEIHQELDRRKIPPAARWPVNIENEQMGFITLLADVHWFTRHNPRHKPKYAPWKTWFGSVSDAWHHRVLIAYEFAQARHGNTYLIKGLALSEKDRVDLMTLKSIGQAARRRPLKQSSDYRIAILSHAVANPDPTGDTTTSTNDRANRRHTLWKMYLLSDQRPATAARWYKAIYGKDVDRGNLRKQIKIVEKAWREFTP